MTIIYTRGCNIVISNSTSSTLPSDSNSACSFNMVYFLTTPGCNLTLMDQPYFAKCDSQKLCVILTMNGQPAEAPCDGSTWNITGLVLPLKSVVGSCTCHFGQKTANGTTVTLPTALPSSNWTNSIISPAPAATSTTFSTSIANPLAVGKKELVLVFALVASTMIRIMSWDKRYWKSQICGRKLCTVTLLLLISDFAGYTLMVTGEHRLVYTTVFNFFLHGWTKYSYTSLALIGIAFTLTSLALLALILFQIIFCSTITKAPI